MRRTVVAGNWKMNTDLESGLALAGAVGEGLEAVDTGENLDVVICPPFISLAPISERLASGSWGLKLGAQNVFHETNGAFTGDVSATMLRSVGCHYTIVGHSERRIRYGLSDGEVGLSAQAARLVGIVPIVCIGETLDEREDDRVEKVIRRQLTLAIDSVADFEECVVAYEPVWAIGTGVTATTDQIAGAHAIIREVLVDRLGTENGTSVPILYGGSMKADNAASIFEIANVDGGLVGGASLDAEEFLSIIRAAVAQHAGG